MTINSADAPNEATVAGPAGAGAGREKTAAAESHSSTPKSPPGATPATGSAGGRGQLDKGRILRAAVAMIDDEGLHHLTMRRLGGYLGVEAMALYHYVPGREALLDGIVETVIDQLYDDPEVHVTTVDWQDYLQRLSHGVRRVALAHPKVFPLIATRPSAAPWVQPPLRSLRWMESFLENLHRCGFSDASSVAAYRAFSSFLLGHLLLEVSARGADIGPIEEPDPGTPQKSDLDGYPRLMKLESELSQDHGAAEFEESLESLLDRLESLSRR